MKKRVFDIVIVGGRVAGLSLAILLQRAGLCVLVIEKDRLPSDKAFSTHFIGVQGVTVLKKLNVYEKLKLKGCPSYTELTLSTPIGKISGATIAYKEEEHTIGPRRYLLDAELLNEAQRAGVHVIDQCVVNALIRCSNTQRILGIICEKDSQEFEYRARAVIGADGTASIVAKEVGSEKFYNKPKLASIFWKYMDVYPSTQVEFHFGPDSSGVCFQASAEHSIVTLTTSTHNFKLMRDNTEHQFIEKLRGNCPEIAEFAEKSANNSPVMGGASVNFFRESAGRGWALVGDAACTHDPVSASGITDALLSAELLSEHLLSAWNANDDELDDALKNYSKAQFDASIDYFNFWCESLETQYSDPENIYLNVSYQNIFWDSLRRNSSKKEAFFGMLTQSYLGGSEELKTAISLINNNS